MFRASSKFHAAEPTGAIVSRWSGPPSWRDTLQDASRSRRCSHIFVSFIAYCLLVTLKNLARPRATGLTPRAILEMFATIQMVDVHLPTTDGRHLVLPRHTRPNKEHELLLHQLGMTMPQQPAPRFSA